MLGGRESPDLARLYHRRVVPLHSHLTVRPRWSSPGSHTGHVGDGAPSTSTLPSLTLRDAAPAPPPLFLPSHGSKHLPSSFSALLQQQIHPPPTYTPPGHSHSMQKVPVPPSPSSPSHPAPQEDHSKSLPCSCRGSSLGSTTREPPRGKTEE